MFIFLDGSVPKEVRKGDWLIVSFPLTNKKGSKRYIGRVLGSKEGRLIGKFVRPKATKQFSGFIYVFPPVDDEYPFKFSQIVRKVPNPSPYGRHSLLKFTINANSL